MKQSALVIATLFAAVQADNRADAKARMERDIKGYLHNGLKFDTKVIRAVHGDVRRQTRIENHWNEEARENFSEGFVVGDEYVNAMKYEKSQETYTPPTAANGQWGNIHYNNPQKIMDNYVAAYKHDQELGEEWREDFHETMEATQRNHQKTGNQISRAWETNGVKAQQFAASAMDNAGAAWQQADVNAPHSLAVDTVEVREDADHFFHALGDASEAVRHTMRVNHELNKKPDRQMDHAKWEYIKAREHAAKGFNKAIEFEIANTHLERGLPGGQGRLDWTNKQQIVNKWAAPMEEVQHANAQFRQTAEQVQHEKMEIHRAVKAEAQKVWPAKFRAVEKSWGALAENFDNEPHSLIVSRAAVKASVTNAWNKGKDLNQSVINDVLTFGNNTQQQRKAFGNDVKTFIKEKKVINQEYAKAFQYESENFHFIQDKATGKWRLQVDNESTIIDNYATAQTNDIMAQQQLKEDWINYQNSISKQKAAFKATANAEWPKKFEAYKLSVQQFEQTIHPHSLITDAEQREAEDINNQVYANINQRLALKWDVKKDLKAYMENTNGAREQLKADAKDWDVAGKRVQDMYTAAWNYQVAQTKFTPASAKGPAHIEMNNQQAVSNNYRAAAQADEDLWKGIRGDVQNFNKQVAPARNVLKNEINNQWVPAAEGINRSDTQIVEEVINYQHGMIRPHAEAFHKDLHHHTDDIRRMNVTHPYANLLAVEGNATMTTSEQLAYGSVFLMAMIAVAALSNKGKAESKSVEFDVEDLEMTNKKESKKQIKKTLKDIMKTSNTKVSILN